MLAALKISCCAPSSNRSKGRAWGVTKWETLAMDVLLIGLLLVNVGPPLISFETAYNTVIRGETLSSLSEVFGSPPGREPAAACAELPPGDCWSWRSDSKKAGRQRLLVSVSDGVVAAYDWDAGSNKGKKKYRGPGPTSPSAVVSANYPQDVGTLLASLEGQVLALAPGTGVRALVCEQRLYVLRSTVAITDDRYRRAERCVREGRDLYQDGYALFQRCASARACVQLLDQVAPGSEVAISCENAVRGGSECLTKLTAIHAKLDAHWELSKQVGSE